MMSFSFFFDDEGRGCGPGGRESRGCSWSRWCGWSRRSSRGGGGLESRGSWGRSPTWRRPAGRSDCGRDGDEIDGESRDEDDDEESSSLRLPLRLLLCPPLPLQSRPPPPRPTYAPVRSLLRLRLRLLPLGGAMASAYIVYCVCDYVVARTPPHASPLHTYSCTPVR